MKIKGIGMKNENFFFSNVFFSFFDKSVWFLRLARITIVSFLLVSLIHSVTGPRLSTYVKWIAKYVNLLIHASESYMRQENKRIECHTKHLLDTHGFGKRLIIIKKNKHFQFEIIHGRFCQNFRQL